MTSQRPDRVDDVFQAALDLPPHERDAFVERACAADADLRRAVGALLGAHDRAQADGFMEGRAFESGVERGGSEDGQAAVGQLIGRYRVVDRIGGGGMGEVFLAHDESLDRRVALKLLSGGLAHDEERVRRFRQEALAASSLNHPNIITIHEVGQWDKRGFMATEFIEGATLRRLMDGKPLPVPQTLDIAVQITRALSAAHGAGIVHRDIKPENVMVRPDGLVKVLDFGIAKYSEGAGDRTAREAPVQTRTGAVVGTTAYMSPEQARGLETDARTDIWSFGCVLYEMLAGRPAFGRATPSDTIAAVLEHEPDWSVLPETVPAGIRRLLQGCLTKDPEERLHDLARARVEIEEALAADRTPPMAPIHGFEQADGASLLVRELIEGPTLAERLQRGSLPVGEAMEIARQIAEAIEAAHQKGIIHCGLKPSNVKLAPNGRVKLLDFGLGKALAEEAGAILGTVPYMSPEQARGEPLDPRTDVWAFGCVLYEMLTGRCAFAAATRSEVIAAILDREPDWAALPEATPTLARSLLRRCLKKDRARRLDAISDARIEIEEALADLGDDGRQRPAARRRWPWLIAGGALVVAALVAVAARERSPRAVARPWKLQRLSVSLPASAPLLDMGLQYANVTFSPDGSRIAYSALAQGRRGVWMRALDRLDPTPLTGAEGGTSPFFSPDGQWVGFLADDRLLKKVRVAGGSALAVCDAPQMRGASWALDGTIVFGTWGGGLMRVSADGGTPEPLTRVDPQHGELDHRWPRVLPSGRVVLFAVGPISLREEDRRVEALSLGTGERKTLIRGGTAPRYATTGHLLYFHAGTMMAAPFDEADLALTAPAVPLLDGLVANGASGYAFYDVSQTGSLVYVAQPASSDATLEWVDRQGRAEVVLPERRPYLEPALSPDGRRIAVTVEGSESHVWIYDLDARRWTRLTTEGNDSRPVWSPDGARVAFSSQRGIRRPLYWQPADGSGPAEPMAHFADAVFHLPYSFTPDGKALVYGELTAHSQWDIWVLPLVGDRRPRPLLATAANEGEARISPDGRWLAYSSNESGRVDVYLRRFPGMGAKWPVSTSGGDDPVWAHDGRVLFYRSGDGKMMSVAVDGQRPSPLDPPRVLFERTMERRYDVTRDRRFLIVRSDWAIEPPQVVVIPDWFEELKAKVPPSR